MFVQHLLGDNKFNPVHAARAAGYKSPHQSAYALLKNEIVAAAVGKAIKVRADKLGLKAEDVLRHLATALYLDPIEIFEDDEDGEIKVKRLKDIPEDVRRCITEMKIKKRKDITGAVTTEYDIELMSKDTALGLVMQHLGLLGKGAVGVNINVDTQLINRLLNEAEARNNVVDSNTVEGEVVKLPGPQTKL